MNYLDSQIKALDKLKKVKCAALFMEAGTGKTRTMLGLLDKLDCDCIIWFTPFQTKNNLIFEISKWSNIICDIIGIESIQLNDKLYLDLIDKLQKSDKSCIIIDESLKIKNIDAKRTKRILELSKYAEYRFILNGTPLSRNLLDLWSQMHFLSPKILNMEYNQFKDTFCEYIEIKSKKQFIIKQYHNIEYLYKLIYPFIYESKLSLSIGQKHINYDYDISSEEMNIYNQLKEKYLDDSFMQEKNNNIFLMITQKMQHIYSLSANKFELVNQLLNTIDQTKTLIYAKYIDTQTKLKLMYPNIKVMSLQKHCYGLNLQQYNTIIFWDKTWDYAQREQSERRVYRTGQDNTCTYYDLTANTKLDALMDSCIVNKRSLLDIFNTYNLKDIL